MFTRSIGIGVLLLAIGVTPAFAIDIQGKWGLGVGASGVIGTNPDVTLLYGRSNSSAWLFTVQFSGSNLNGDTTFPIDTTLSSPIHNNQNQLFVGVAPGIRRFLRPEGAFSPYVDLSAGGFYNHSHQYLDQPGAFVRGEGNTWGLDVSCAFGAEYFTPWHFSVAAHSGLASVNWFSTHQTYEPSNGATYEQKSNGARASFGVSPVLALRVYF